MKKSLHEYDCFGCSETSTPVEMEGMWHKAQCFVIAERGDKAELGWMGIGASWSGGRCPCGRVEQDSV